MKAGVREAQAVGCNTVDCVVIKHYNSIALEAEALKGKQGIIGLYHNVTCGIA